MSESQKQLLKTMLFYDLQNYVELERAKQDKASQDTSELDTVAKYMKKRISQLESK